MSRKDFATLAISNLLEEELDWIANNGFYVDSQKIKNHIKRVKTVKIEADGWVLNRD